MTDDDARATLARAAAEAGAERAAASFRTDHEIERKDGKTDLVTAADRGAQRAAVERLRETVPDEPIVAEEVDARKTVPESGPAWVIDPIDGTANYVRGSPAWATSVAALEDGRPVAATSVLPALGDTVSADGDRTVRDGEAVATSGRTDPETLVVGVLGRQRDDDRGPYVDLATAVIEGCGDVRRLGSMHVTLAGVATGELDAAVTSGRPRPWDSLPGVALVEAAGGRVTDLEGRPWRHDSDHLVASNGPAHGAVLSVARSALHRD